MLLHMKSFPFFSLFLFLPVPIHGGPRRQQLRFSPYAGTSNRNRIREEISASRDQDMKTNKIKIKPLIYK